MPLKSFDQICKFSPGEDYLEDLGICPALPVRIQTKPVVTGESPERQVKFNAVVISGDRAGEVINYLFTENYMHYGSKMYDIKDA